MKLSRVLELYKLAEEEEIEIRDTIEFDEKLDIDVGTRVLLNNGKRRRIVDLGILTIIYDCNKDFVKDYLNLNYSLEDIHKKYGVYTELEYLAMNCEDMVKDKDLLEVLKKLKTYILRRENRDHGF